MSAHVLLNLLNELGKREKCDSCRAFYFFFATSLINSLIQEHVFWMLKTNVSLRQLFSVLTTYAMVEKQ